jgi:hypothetical protein
MAFTDREKARIKHFLAYPDVSMLAASIQLGYPSASQPAFLVDDSFQRLTEEGEATVLRDLCECEAIEKQISQARERFKATQLGSLKTNPEEVSMLRTELKQWTDRLASDLSVYPNPYAQSAGIGSAGGVNSKVIG